MDFEIEFDSFGREKMAGTQKTKTCQQTANSTKNYNIKANVRLNDITTDEFYMCMFPRLLLKQT